MSAWSDPIIPDAVLGGAAGELVSIRITVDPHRLESLLEALAAVSFPVNPQLHHQAVLVGIGPGGRREARAVTVVEFPAYENHLAEVKTILEKGDFPPDTVHLCRMLDDIQSGSPERADVPWLVWQEQLH
jgi:hypothetical protein